MQLAKENNQAHYVITAYDAGTLVINREEKYHSPMILGPNTLLPWSVDSLTALQVDDFDPILALEPSVVLIGTGKEHIHLPPRLFTAFYEKHTGVEIMSTASACKTYNLLAADDRKVVAALWIGSLESKPNKTPKI